MEPRRALVWHALALAWFASISFALTRVGQAGGATPSPGFALGGGVWKYLTFLNLVLQAVSCGVSVLVDVCTLMKRQEIAKIILPLRDLLFGSLGFPISLFVFTCFWVIYFYDRELVYPKSLDAVIPPWLNHAMHTSVCPHALIELCFIPHRYPSKRKRFTLLGMAALGYIFCTVQVYRVTGKWTYPIMGALNLFGKVAFFLVGIGVVTFYCQMGSFLCRMIWGDTVVIFDASKKKSK